MRLAFRHTGWVLMQVIHHFSTLVLRINLVWLLASVPILPAVGVPLAIAVQQAAGAVAPAIPPLLILTILVGATAVACVPAGPATLALFDVTARFLAREDVTVRSYLQAMRTFLVRGWIVLFLDLIVLFTLAFGFYFYLNSGRLETQVLAFVSLYFVLVWIGTQAYLFPLAVRPHLTLSQAFRTAVVLALSGFGTTAGYVLVVIVTVAGSAAFLLPLLVMVPVTLALVGHRLTQDRLRTLGYDELETEPGTAAERS